MADPQYVSAEMQREQMSKKQKQKNDDIAAEKIRDFGRRSSMRGNFETYWKEVAERIDPVNSKNFNAYNQQQTTQGEKRTELIYDSTATIALQRFTSILDSLLTPRNQMWHRLIADSEKLNKSRSVRLYFEEVNRLLFKYRYAPRANFASQNQQNFKSLGAYGNGAMFIDDLAGGERGIRYKNIHLSQLFFAENHQGLIDDVFRFFPLTSRQAIQKWGEQCPDQIKSAAKVNPDQEFYFLHCVHPKNEYDPGRKDFRGMPFSSYYIEMQSKQMLSEGGYNTFPYAISRYEQAENEVYGRSPAMDVLPSIKTLNEQKKTLLKQGHRALDPVLLAYDDGVLDNFSMSPGALNAGGVTADGRPLVHALPTGNIAAGKETMDDERAVVNDAFLVTIFQILTETPAMTATEVLERTREKGILLAPTVGRQQSECLGPMIEREIDILSRQGLLPPMPRELIEARGEYKIVYDSPLSRAQRAEEASGLMRTVEAAMNVAATTMNPNILDHFNWDVIVPEMADIQGVPESWLNSQDQIAQLREQRAQMQQAQMANQALPGTAAIMKAQAASKKAGAES